jgi:hypothetical protein
MPSRRLTMGYVANGSDKGSRLYSAVFAASLAIAACTTERSRPPESPRAATSSAPSSAAAGEALDHDWGERTLTRIPVTLKLPDATAWHARASGSFTELSHAPSSSLLTFRIERASRLVRPEECEAAARLARPTLPLLDASSVVERRKLAAPPGFDTRLVVGVVPREGARVLGVALAIGAATGRCYVASYETESRGAGAPERVAERLAIIVSGVFETLRTPGAEARVPPPPGVK